MKFSEIKWTPNGYITLQDADQEKHVLGMICRAENGVITEIRVRHNDGEEYVGTVTCDGEKVLPLDMEKFKSLYKKGKLEIK